MFCKSHPVRSTLRIARGAIGAPNSLAKEKLEEASSEHEALSLHLVCVFHKSSHMTNQASQLSKISTGTHRSACNDDDTDDTYAFSSL